jgi:hypothetical protein
MNSTEKTTFTKSCRSFSPLVMPRAHARIAVTASFVAVSVIGAGWVFAYWFAESTVVATARSMLFVLITACIHGAGYLMYIQQDAAKPAEAVPKRTSFELSHEYWHALKHAILLQALFGVLTGLMLDGGRSFGFFKVAFVGHWVGILLIIGRRPLAPTKTDILCIRWGTVLLLAVADLGAPLVWSIVGESSLTGWERLWH